MSNSLQPHGLQHARVPCLSLSPGVCANSCPLSCWCYLTISSSAAPLSFCHQSFPASRPFPMSWLLASGSQTIGTSASESVLPMNIQGWFPLGLTGLISLLSKDSQKSSPAPQFESIYSSALKLFDGVNENFMAALNWIFLAISWGLVLPWRESILLMG